VEGKGESEAFRRTGENTDKKRIKGYSPGTTIDERLDPNLKKKSLKDIKHNHQGPASPETTRGGGWGGKETKSRTEKS